MQENSQHVQLFFQFLTLPIILIEFCADPKNMMIKYVFFHSILSDYFVQLLLFFRFRRGARGRTRESEESKRRARSDNERVSRLLELQEREKSEYATQMSMFYYFYLKMIIFYLFFLNFYIKDRKTTNFLFCFCKIS